MWDESEWHQEALGGGGLLTFAESSFTYEYAACGGAVLTNCALVDEETVPHNPPSPLPSAPPPPSPSLSPSHPLPPSPSPLPPPLASASAGAAGRPVRG